MKTKFKVGDWIVDNCGNVWKIKLILNGFYVLEGVEGDESLPTIEFVDETCHLWSIVDANPGDVLYFNDDTMVIFKDLYNSSTFHSYCHIEDGLFDISEDNFPDWWESEGFQPATKEQCNLLFQIMKKSGYIWDKEKKELKKIELQSSQWNISDFRTWQYIVSDVLTKHDGIGQYLDDGLCKKIAQDMQKEWSKKLRLIQHTDWSPSDEQLEIIDMLLTNKAMDDHVVKILKGLKEQLNEIKK